MNVYRSIFSCIFLYYVYGIMIYFFFYSVQYAIIVFLVLIAEIAGVVLAALMKKDVSTPGCHSRYRWFLVYMIWFKRTRDNCLNWDLSQISIKTIVCFTTKVLKNIGILYNLYQMDADSNFNKVIKSFEAIVSKLNSRIYKEWHLIN